VSGVVTGLKVEARRRGKVRVEIDGASTLVVAKTLAASLRLGQRLSDEELASLARSEAVEEAVQRGLRLVALRPRSERELGEALSRAHVPEAVQQAALARLRETGAADDQAFAQAWVENRQAFRPRSRLALKVELRRKGVAADTISAILEDVDDEGAALQAARAAGRRLQGLPQDEFRRRLGGILARRGFDYSIVRPVVERLWRETSGETVESEGA
jgi:regulatory protein